MKIKFFLIILFCKKRNGIQKKVIEIKLSVQVPIIDNICIDSIDQDQVYEIRFHGKPVNKFPLKNSNTEKIKEYSENYNPNRISYKKEILKDLYSHKKYYFD